MPTSKPKRTLKVLSSRSLSGFIPRSSISQRSSPVVRSKAPRQSMLVPLRVSIWSQLCCGAYSHIADSDNLPRKRETQRRNRSSFLASTLPLSQVRVERSMRQMTRISFREVSTIVLANRSWRRTTTARILLRCRTLSNNSRHM